MARLFGLLVLLGLAWLLVRRAPRPRFEKTVRCQRCGVHLPLSLARAERDYYICDAPGCAQHGKPRPCR